MSLARKAIVMKFLIKAYVVFVVVLSCKLLVADDFLNFASQNAAITCADGVQFNIGKNSHLSINGTLGFAGNRETSLSGDPINFSQGYLRAADGRQVLLNAVLDSNDDSCSLYSGVLVAQDGIAFKNINVDGQANTIAGVLHITGAISVTRDANLTIDLQNALEGDIVLNGGRLVLGSNLVLAPGIKIVGPGFIDIQQYKLYAQPGDDTSWVAELIFENGGGIDMLGGDSGGLSLPQSLFNTGMQSNGHVVVLHAGQYHVTNAQPIVIGQNTTLNGGSGVISLTTNVAPYGRVRSKVSADAQIRVAAGKILTLKNIVISNITAKTFDLGVGAVVAFGENVSLEFGSDAFLSDGLFKILNTQSGDSNVVRMRGMNGRKLFVLSPTDINQQALLDLNGNSVLLQDLELIGAGFIVGGNDTGSLALAGNAVLNIETSTDLNIDVEDTGNVLALTQDALTLSGAFSFTGLSAENSLTVRFVLNEPVADKVVTMVGPDEIQYQIPVKKGNPLVVFDGDPGVFLMSDGTLAGMIFADASVSIVNGLDTNTNGFVVDQNSYLMAMDLEVLGHPIKQCSAQFTLGARSVVGEGFDQGFIRFPSPLIPQKMLKRTAFTQYCIKRRACKPVAKHRVPMLRQVSKRKVAVAIKREQQYQRGRRLHSPRNNRRNTMLSQTKKMKNSVMRVLDEPAAYLRTVTDTEITGNAAESGTTLYTRALVKNFESVRDVEFTSTLQDGAQLQQKIGTTFWVDAKHKINVVGPDNRIEITGDAVIDLSELHFGTNAGLTMHCNQLGLEKPTIILSRSLDLPAGAGLNFSGAGNVIFQDRAEIVCNGTIRDRSVFLISNGIEMSVASGGVAYVGGVGRFVVTDKGCLRIDNNAKLHVGDLVSAVGRVHDIDFTVSGKSAVLVAMDAGSRAGLMRFAGGRDSSVDFNLDNSSLVIGPNGTLAFNVMRDAVHGVQRGLLRSFSMRQAQLRLYGTMVFGPNRYDDRFVSLETQCNLFDSTILENGILIVLQHNPIKEVTTSKQFQVRESAVAAVRTVVGLESLPGLLGAGER